MDELNIEWIHWSVLLLFGGVFIFVAPYSKTLSEFFSATTASGKQPNRFVLTGSLVISWIFAKSITNAAVLAQDFGMVGSVAYALYYLSFVVAGIVIYQLRTQGGFSSIHDFLLLRYGRQAVSLFSILIAFRLFNEVWSNTMVVGSYFGEVNSTGYYSAIVLFTLLTLIYTLKGGLRSSLLTDAVQMIFFSVLLIILLSVILPSSSYKATDYLSSGSWSFSGGLNLIAVVLIQVFSYPFHDSVMTDRGFITKPKTMLYSFIWAGIIGFICILAFSQIGIYAQLHGIVGNPSEKVSHLFGLPILLAMNLIMITSAASTLDSAFSSFSKLIVIDLGSNERQSTKRGRWTMILMAVLGSIPIFLNPKILSATTISGTMVLGLAPVFLLWKWESSKLSFYGSVLSGIAFGLILAMGWYPQSWVFTNGAYNDLLSSNVIATAMSFFAFLLPLIWSRHKKKKYETS